MAPAGEETGITTGAVEAAVAGAALSVDGISRSFGPLMAVRDLSFEARSGEIIGLLGPNGAGKTTAIRVLSTILPPTHGSFTLGGAPHTRPSAIRQTIGVLPVALSVPGALALAFVGLWVARNRR